MIATIYDTLYAAAMDAGDIAGRHAATNYVGRDNAATMLEGINAGDPAVLDTLPMLDLSGQWADGPTGAEVLWAIGRHCPTYSDYLDTNILDTDTADAFIVAYRDAFDAAVSEKIEADAIDTLRAINVEEIESLTAFRLANAADVPCPDSDTSAGADFLRAVRDAFVERYTYKAEHGETFDADDVTSLADDAPDVYTGEMWAEFVDLAAYREDISEFGDSSADMDYKARYALYVIAERLIQELARLASIDL